MRGYERIVAIVFGLLLITVGFVAVFVTENEGASAVAVLVGAAAVLVGLQGTPLIEVGMGDNRLKLAQREEVAERALEEAETSPRAASAMLEGYRVADPGARLDPTFTAAVANVSDAEEYERQVVGTLRQVAGPNAAVRFRGGVGDYAIVGQGSIIAIETVYTRGGHVGMKHVWRGLERARTAGADALVIVTNAHGMSSATASLASSYDIPVRVVEWDPDQGYGPIAEAVDELRSRLDPGQSPS